MDQRPDIYSLGIVLSEMFTGRVPYEAETPLAVILKKLQQPLPPPSSINPAISPIIEAVVRKALAANPAQRFNTIQEFWTVWKQANTDASVVPQGPPVVHRQTLDRTRPRTPQTAITTSTTPRVIHRTTN